MCAPLDNNNVSRTSVSDYKFNAICFYGAIGLSTLFFIGCVLIIYAFELPHHESVQLMMLTVVGNFVTSSTLCLIVLFKNKCSCRKETEDLLSVSVEPYSVSRSNSSALERAPRPFSRERPPPPSYHESEQFFNQNRFFSSESTNNQSFTRDQDMQRYSRYINYVSNPHSTSSTTEQFANRSTNIPVTRYSTPNSSQSISHQILDPTAATRTSSAPAAQLMETAFVCLTSDMIQSVSDTVVGETSGTQLPITECDSVTEIESVSLNDSYESESSHSSSCGSVSACSVSTSDSDGSKISHSVQHEGSCAIENFTSMCSNETLWSHSDLIKPNFMEYSGETANTKNLNIVTIKWLHDSTNLLKPKQNMPLSSLLNDSELFNHLIQPSGLKKENELKLGNRQSKYKTQFYPMNNGSDFTISPNQSRVNTKMNGRSTNFSQTNDLDILDEALRQFDLCLELQYRCNERKTSNALPSVLLNESSNDPCLQLQHNSSC